MHVTCWLAVEVPLSVPSGQYSKSVRCRQRRSQTARVALADSDGRSDDTTSLAAGSGLARVRLVMFDAHGELRSSSAG